MYQLYVTDGNGCVDSSTYYVPAFVACDSVGYESLQTVDVLCFGDSTGSIIAIPDSIGI